MVNEMKLKKINNKTLLRTIENFLKMFFNVS